VSPCLSFLLVEAWRLQFQLAITDSLLCFFRLERILEHDKFVRDELTLSMKKARINFFGDILPGASEICSKGNKHPEDGIRQE